MHSLRLLACVLTASLLAACATSAPGPEARAAAAELTPGGTLRAAIN